MAEQTQKQEYTRSADFTSVYSNSARITVNLWDFRMLFGELEEATPELLKVTEGVKVIMSPQHVKVFLKVLERNVRKYEETFGEIKLPPGVGDEEGDHLTRPQKITRSTKN
jgi:hypothetical protein